VYGENRLIKLNKSFSLLHPNIFVFIDVLTQLQIHHTYILMQNTDKRLSITPTRYLLKNIDLLCTYSKTY